VLAAILRPGNAGANNADDHLEVFEAALEQLPREALEGPILALPERAWRPAINTDGQPRAGAWVAELTAQVSRDGWPQGSRLIVRRERPHPGAQLSFTDVDGHRFQCLITDQGDRELAAHEARHRAHAIVEDRVRALKSTVISNLRA
jgi:hypothetical protein